MEMSGSAPAPARDRGEVTLRPAAPADLPAVEALLREAGLPREGVADQFGEAYVLAVAGDTPVGAAGMEVHGEYGLLRSVVVSPGWRGAGVGERLVRDRLEWAAARGLREVYLLTTSAAAWFPRLGFVPARRDEAPAELRASGEFASVCPASAAVLRRGSPAPPPVA